MGVSVLVPPASSLERIFRAHGPDSETTSTRKEKTGGLINSREIQPIIMANRAERLKTDRQYRLDHLDLGGLNLEIVFRSCTADGTGQLCELGGR